MRIKDFADLIGDDARWNHPMQLTFLFLMLLSVLLQAGCGPVREEETWNSYYYGTDRDRNGNVSYPEDNDEHYVPPPGMWQDDQIPQGQKWK